MSPNKGATETTILCGTLATPRFMAHKKDAPFTCFAFYSPSGIYCFLLTAGLEYLFKVFYYSKIM